MHELEIAEHHDVRALKIQAKAAQLVDAFVAAHFSGEERYRGRLAKVTESEELGCPPPTALASSAEKGWSR
jgi:hypothetical protein